MLLKHHGKIDVPWGSLNRIIRGDSDFPVGGGPDILRAIYASEPDDEGRLHARGGDTYIAFVEWDADGTMSAKTIHQYGSATQDESSPHFNDQTSLYANEQFKPFLMDIDQIEKNLSSRYRPGAE